MPLQARRLCSVTTLINVVLDGSKMAVVRAWARGDPLTGGSSLIAPEAKLGAACAALFLSFFSLAQARAGVAAGRSSREPAPAR